MIEIVEFLKEVSITYVKKWGYSGLFGISFVGTSFIPIPVEVVTFLAVGLGLEPIKAGLAAGVGSALGSSINYAIGYVIGMRILKKYFKEPQIAWAMQLYGKYGFFALVIAAFTPIPWDIFTFLSGILKYNFPKYMLASAIGRIPRFLLISLFGAEALKWLVLIF